MALSLLSLLLIVFYFALDVVVVAGVFGYSCSLWLLWLLLLLVLLLIVVGVVVGVVVGCCCCG